MINSFKTLIPPTGFVADEQFNKSLEFCENLALTGTTEEKNDFVAWCHDSITYLTEQLSFSGDDDYRFNLYRVKAQYAVYFDALQSTENEAESIQSLMDYSGLSKPQIYYIARKLGRLPTREELDNRPKSGRPKKY